MNILYVVVIVGLIGLSIFKEFQYRWALKKIEGLAFQVDRLQAQKEEMEVQNACTESRIVLITKERDIALAQLDASEENFRIISDGQISAIEWYRGMLSSALGTDFTAGPNWVNIAQTLKNNATLLKGGEPNEHE